MDRKEEICKMADTLYPDEFSSSIGQRFGLIPVDRSNEREVFIKSAKWADQTMIKKACKWLDENCRRHILTAKDISDFKKAMEE